MEDVELVEFEYDRDMDDILRVWTETGWFDGEDRPERFIKQFFEANDGRSVVARLNGHTESVVHRSLGSMHYDDTQVSLGGVTAVTTSRIARRLRMASRLTARTVAHLGDEGVAVAALGMFEQGFYDRVGFAAGSYENRVQVYPGDLDIPVPYRTPERLDLDDDLEEIHAAIVDRMPWHGGIAVGGERLSQAGAQIDDQPTLFGYRTDGTLSHFLMLEMKGENGPDRVLGMAYQTKYQCLELLRLIQEWGDQVDSIRFVEPVWLKAQEFMRQPGREYRRTKGTAHEMHIDADAWWQARIVDLDACVRAMRPAGREFSIAVEVDDPIQDHLVDSGYAGSWQPLSGLWRLTFGPNAGAERLAPDTANDTPADLVTTVNALTQWWLGVTSADTLAVVGAFEAKPDVIDQLDDLTAHLPTPQLGWDI